MVLRRSPAIVLSFVLSAAALLSAPAALASDGGTAKEVVDKDLTSCEFASSVRLKVLSDNDGRLTVIGSVYSEDENYWDWKLKHNGDYSYSGEVKARDADRSFKVTRSMFDLPGVDDVYFRAVNNANGEVCKIEVSG